MSKTYSLALLLLLSVACWFFVFNKPARYKYLRHRYERDKMTEDEREMNDAARYAFVLVLALTFTVAFLSFSMAAFIGLIRPG